MAPTIRFPSQKYLPNPKMIVLKDTTSGATYQCDYAQKYDHGSTDSDINSPRMEEDHIFWTVGIDEMEGVGRPAPLPDWTLTYAGKTYTISKVDSSEALQFYRLTTTAFPDRSS